MAREAKWLPPDARDNQLGFFFTPLFAQHHPRDSHHFDHRYNPQVHNFDPTPKMLEKLCLQWNDFQDNVKTAFGNLRQDKHFTDVTLACEDGQQVEAHKVILAASSPFFQNLLETNKHPHPLVCMRGLKSSDLVAIVDFIYFGETNVYQENLDSFMVIAEELQLKGLRRNSNRQVESIITEENQWTTQRQKPLLVRDGVKVEETYEGTQKDNVESESSKVVADLNDFSGNLEDIDNKVKSLMEKSENYLAKGHQKADICKVCGKEGKSDAIRNHIEAKHLGGIVIPCDQCGKTYGCRDSLRRHMQKQHRNSDIIHINI